MGKEIVEEEAGMGEEVVFGSAEPVGTAIAAEEPKVGSIWPVVAADAPPPRAWPAAGLLV